MESQLEISVITVNYNGFHDTCEFIDSWTGLITSVSYEIIVVDNASSNEEGLRLQQHYPQLTVICSARNLGFAGANNLGIKQAQGKYLFFLNNDVLMVRDTIRALTDRLASSKRIAGLSPLIRDAHPPFAIQFAGYTPLSVITLRNRAIGEGSVHPEDYPACRTPYLHGAAMLLKKSIIDKLGPMPTDYFLYYEELDWSTYITTEGYELWYEPACEVRHKASRSTGENSPLKTFYLSRNRLMYAYRNRFDLTLHITLFYQIAIVLPKVVILSLLQGRKDLAKAHWEGVKAFFVLKNKDK